MAKNDVTVDDVKATAKAKVDDLQDSAQEQLENAKEVVSGLTKNQKVILTGLVTLAVAVVTRTILQKRRTIVVDNADQVVLVATDNDVSEV